jgi:hypothetical protein
LGPGRDEHTMRWARHGSAYLERQRRKFRDNDDAGLRQTALILERGQDLVDQLSWECRFSGLPLVL